MAEKNKNEVAEKKPSNFTELVEWKLNDISDALPSDLNKTKFVTNAMALLNADEKLKQCDQPSLLQGLMQSAVLGLDAIQKECYLIPYGKRADFQISYTGMRKLALKYSTRPLKDIRSNVVREGDELTVTTIDGRTTYTFKPIAFNKKPIVGAFAVAEFADGDMQVEMMSDDDIKKIRNGSKAKNSPAWSQYEDEMSRKAVTRRLCKHIQLNLENDKQVQAFDEDGALEEQTEAPIDVFAEAKEVVNEDNE